MPIFVGSMLFAKLWPMKIMLPLANKLGCLKLIVETDSQVIYQWMTASRMLCQELGFYFFATWAFPCISSQTP